MPKVPQISAHTAGSSLAAGSTTYMAWGSCTRPLTKATESDCQDRIRYPGVSSGLRAYVLSNALSAGQTLVITSRVAAADGGQSLTINNGVTGYVEGTGSDTLADGDLFNFKAAMGTGGAVVISSVTHDFEADSGVCVTRVSARSVTGAFANNTRYGGCNTELGNASTTVESDWQLKVPSAFTVRHLRTYISTNSKSSTTTLKSRKGGADSVTLTSYTGGQTGEQEDTSNTTTLAVDDLYNFAITTGSGTQAFNNFNGASIQASFEHATDMFFGSLGLSVLASVAAGATQYAPPAGQNTTSGTEAEAKVRIKQAFKAKKLRVQITTNTIDSGSSTFKIRVNGSDTGIVVTVASGAGTGWFEDASNTYDFAVDDDVSVEIVGGGTSGAVSFGAIIFAGEFSTAATLTVAEATHGHTVDNLDLVQQNTLVVDETLHTHTVDSASLTQQNTLALQESLHSHSADNVVLTQQNILAVQEALHAHLVDNLTLDSSSQIVVQEAMHAHSADNVVLVQANVIVVQESTHAHSVDGVALAQQHMLVVQESLHAHSADSPAITFTAFLVVQEALHDHNVDNVILSTNLVLVVSDALHAHFADNANIPTPGLVPLEILTITFAFHKSIDRELVMIKHHSSMFPFTKEREQGFGF